MIRRVTFVGLFLAGSSVVARKILILSGKKIHGAILGIIAGLAIAPLVFPLIFQI